MLNSWRAGGIEFCWREIGLGYACLLLVLHARERKEDAKPLSRSRKTPNASLPPPPTPLRPAPMSDPKGAPPANSSSPSRSTPTRPFAALKLDALKSNLDEFLMSSVLNNSPLGSTARTWDHLELLPVLELIRISAATKEPLSLQTTSNNFRRLAREVWGEEGRGS